MLKDIVIVLFHAALYWLKNETKKQTNKKYLEDFMFGALTGDSAH